MWVSVIILPILTPKLVTWNSIELPVTTVRDPVIITFWNSGLINDAVDANDELIAEEAVKADDAETEFVEKLEDIALDTVNAEDALIAKFVKDELMALDAVNAEDADKEFPAKEELTALDAVNA